MKYTIVTQQQGRLRVRAGQYAFTEEQGQGIISLLLPFDGVDKVETCYKNGSILVLYHGEKVETQVLKTLLLLRVSSIVSEPVSIEVQQEAQEKGLRQDLAVLCGRHYLFKWFLPTSLVPWYNWWKGLRYLKDGVESLARRTMSVELLDATAIGISLWRKDFKTASSTMFLLQLSDLLLNYSNTRAKNQLSKSLAIPSQTLWLVEEQGERQVSLDTLTEGDVIRLRKGAMVPVDGTIVAGEAMFNESTMTGEPLAVHKTVEGSVFAGTILEEGEVDISVRTLGENTRIAQIVDFIQNGEDTKANIQGQAERLADKIVPYSFGLFLGTLAFTQNFSRALSVLMVDFSCAIKLTTPIAVISALKEGAEEGILVKGGKYLELLSQVDTVVFDKTGTLTEAVPQVAKIVAVSDTYSEDEILTIAACMEEHFPHSVAAAIVEEAKTRGLSHPETHGKVEYIVAHGIVTLQNNLRSCIGSYHFIFDDENIPYPSEKKQWLEDEIGSHSAVYLAIGGELVGVLCIYDPPRPEAKAVVSKLRELGIGQIMMITGDSEGTAAAISKELELDSYIASVLPDGKAKQVEKLKEEGCTVLMVGDGINDAPGLSCANVSITLAGSSDIAREVADITILSHDLYDIVRARQLSTGLMNKISTHYRWIVGFNGSLLGLGVFGVLTAGQNAWLHNASTLGFAGLSTKPLFPRIEKQEYKKLN